MWLNAFKPVLLDASLTCENEHSLQFGVFFDNVTCIAWS
uniref:Uncharacterized protein n=1 Tax=Rhizophora mucronata TaxID=61149 RepID=A0A2P2N6Y2_RHIMU